MTEEMVQLLRDIMANKVMIPENNYPQDPVEAALAILQAACRFVEFLEPYERYAKAHDRTKLSQLIRAFLAAREYVNVRI